MRTRSATLSRRLHSVEAKLVAVSRQRHQLELALSNSLAKSNRSAQLASSEQRTLIAFRHRAAAVNSDLVSLEAYVRSTPAQALDSGFLQSQLAYLAKAALGLQRP